MAAGWMKAPAAAAYCGGISTKVLYRAVRERRLRAARIGSGRNVLFHPDLLDEWLTSTVERPIDEPQDARARR